jgi:hypothetical protein
MERRSFDREFRDGAVRIVRETGKPVAQVARELARSPRPSRAGPDRHAARVEAYANAGVDEAYVQQIGPDMAVFVAAREKDVLPRFTRNPVVLVISIDVSAMARRRHPH